MGVTSLPQPRNQPLFVRGDFDAFVGLGLDNLVQLIIAVGLCSKVLHFPTTLIYSTILPAIALSYLAGNSLYAWLARRLAMKEGRADVCAIPYGLHTIPMIAYSLLVMLPALHLAEAQGDPEPWRTAWKVGSAACFISGLVQLSFSLVADTFRRLAPPGPMLAALGGLSLVFLSGGFLLEGMVHPLVGLVALMILLSMFFGRYSFRGGMSAVLVSAGVGAVLCWLTGIAPNGPCPLDELGLHAPNNAFLNLQFIFQPKELLPYLPVILPISFFAVVGAVQNVESAAAAGDNYRVRDALLIDGMGTMVGACLGSPFPLTIYIGHPCWKEIGARAGYSFLNGLFVTAVCLSGSTAVLAWLIPEDAGLPLIIWAGLIIGLQSFQKVERRYWISIVVGMLPALGAWLSQSIKNILVTTATPSELPTIFSSTTLDKWHQHHIYIDGAFALEQGFVFTSIVWSAIIYYIIDRRFYTAAAWSVFASFLSIIGLIHSWKFAPGGTAINMPLLDWLCGQTPVLSWEGLFPGWPYAAAYVLIAGFLLASQKWAVHAPAEPIPL